jgi:hypothetical protein
MRPRWSVLSALLAACVALTAQACVSSRPIASPTTAPMTLSIANGTTISVQLVVNGSVIETVPPGGYQDPIASPLPPLPWTVEARTTSGRVLEQMTVQAGDVVYATPDPSGTSSAKGDGMRVDLSCGRLDVWSGPPLLGPIPGPGQSGDCAP